MTIVLEQTRPVARKRHFCDACFGWIGEGDTYLRQRGISDDGPYTFKAHLLCSAAWSKAHRDADLYPDESPDEDEVRDLVRHFFAVICGAHSDEQERDNRP